MLGSNKKIVFFTVLKFETFIKKGSTLVKKKENDILTFLGWQIFYIECYIFIGRFLRK